MSSLNQLGREDLKNLFLEALREPVNSRTHWMDRKLREAFPELAVVECEGFDSTEFAISGFCELSLVLDMHPEIRVNHFPGYALTRSDVQTWRVSQWKGQRIDLVSISWSETYCTKEFTWVLAQSVEIAEAYIWEVEEWNSEVRGEILVFDGGQWGKSKELFESIQSASFDNLILPDALKKELQSDFGTFFASRKDFERFGVPWKRGVLLYGPPGNGKTHTLKSLINWLNVPCLYVKSLEGHRMESDHSRIHKVFTRARATTPCLLVLEDLDSLINSTNRSFFLNELDGFSANTGVVIVATTNHPERLDPAILDRPSRFDRKYEFTLPAPKERRSYLELWSNRAEEGLRLTSDELNQIAELTSGFSFAYLKELWLSSMMRWMEFQRSGEMGTTMIEQVTTLRSQMSEPISESAPSVDDEGDVDQY